MNFYTCEDEYGRPTVSVTNDTHVLGTITNHGDLWVYRTPHSTVVASSQELLGIAYKVDELNEREAKK